MLTEHELLDLNHQGTLGTLQKHPWGLRHPQITTAWEQAHLSTHQLPQAPPKGRSPGPPEELPSVSPKVPHWWGIVEGQSPSPEEIKHFNQ